MKSLLRVEPLTDQDIKPLALFENIKVEPKNVETIEWKNEATRLEALLKNACSEKEYWQKRWENEHIENLTSQLEVQAQKCFIENLVKLVAKKDTEIIEKEADIAKKNAELTRKEADFKRKEAEVLWLQKQIDENCDANLPPKRKVGRPKKTETETK
uniref:Uncharacterized protein n=1 Tax=Acrobeloides nanus TaxID=290746 RepID=A0A914E9Z9_9BILA